MAENIFPNDHPIYFASVNTEIKQISGLPKGFQYRLKTDGAVAFLHHQKCDSVFAAPTDATQVVQAANSHVCLR
jgi:hypothetical protein